MRSRLIAFILLVGSVLSASEFQDGQAARAVIGQPSFSAHDRGIVARALSISKGNLYVADNIGHLLTYDVSQIGSARTPGCPVCVVAPQSASEQNVFEGVAASAVNGQNVAIADASSRHVMLWYGVSPIQKPNVVLSGFANPVSVALDDQRLFVGDAGSHHVYIWNSLPHVAGQLPDVTLGMSEGMDGVGADTIQTPAALASDGANLFVADSDAHRVLIFSPALMAMPQVLNAATLSGGALAPGTLFLLDHGASSASVFLNGNPLRVADLNGDQMQLQIPYELNNATAASMWVKTEQEDGTAITSRPVAVRFAAASPGIFAFGAQEPRTGMLLHASEAIPLSPEQPARPGEVLTVWATGLGAIASEANTDGGFTTLIPVRASVNGNSVEVLSAELPAEATGIYEVRLRLPASMPAGANLILAQNDVKSNVVTFPVEK